MVAHRILVPFVRVRVFPRQLKEKHLKMFLFFIILTGMIENKRTDAVRMIRKVTIVGFWINAALVVLKLFFGYWGHSDALVADGYHSLSDFLTDFLVIFFIGIAYKKADRDHPYGHGKFETAASVLISLILIFVAIGIGYGGIKSIVDSFRGVTIERPDFWTIIIAAISIFAKEFCYRYTVRVGKKLNSSSLIANAWHHRSDAISSVATVIGVSLSYFLGPQWRILDPVASILIAIFILISAIKIARPSINELLEMSVPEKEIQKIRTIVKGVDGVKRVHNLRCRNNGHSLIIDMNIHVDPEITIRMGHAIATDVENCLHVEFGDDIIIYVHVEPENS